jgi:hypothetical protein
VRWQRFSLVNSGAYAQVFINRQLYIQQHPQSEVWKIFCRINVVDNQTATIKNNHALLRFYLWF